MNLFAYDGNNVATNETANRLRHFIHMYKQMENELTRKVRQGQIVFLAREQVADLLRYVSSLYDLSHLPPVKEINSLKLVARIRSGEEGQ